MNAMPETTLRFDAIQSSKPVDVMHEQELVRLPLE
jgi:hypothetical protein